MRSRSLSLLFALLIHAAAAVAQTAADQVRASAHPLTDYGALMDAIGDRRFVLMGEASHGTAEFYRERARITRQLIEEKQFRAVVLEASWSDVARVDAYIRGAADRDPLLEFTEFPVWMWRNAEFAAFVRWAREHNRNRQTGEPEIRIFGLDLYTAFESMDALVAYLRTIDAAAAARAVQRYSCFDAYRADLSEYARAVRQSRERSCQEQAAAVYEELSTRFGEVPADEPAFHAVQHARVVMNAEAFYRAAASGRSSWNVRDTHMTETLAALATHLDASFAPTRFALWAHNTHVGDASATDMASYGDVNIGQLVRQRWPGQSFHVGFSMYGGAVMAAHTWGGAGEVMALRPADPSLVGALFHSAGIGDFYLLTSQVPALAEGRWQRAVGVLYRPLTERQSHFIWGTPANQYDAMIHIEESHAVTPLTGWLQSRRRAVRTP
ncbi:MAG TPA: erythromycin esterase family protein [Thermoanaerobaculia bacterium]|jgi:erythromycin esterase-like protein